MLFDFRLLAGALMGWSLGANDTASVFGLAITSHVVRTRTALALTAFFVVVGAVLQGHGGITTYGALGPQSVQTAFIVSITPALALLVTATIGLPVSTTQAVVGAITGLSLLNGTANWPVLFKLAISWAVAPLGTMLFAFLLYKTLGRIFERWLMRLSSYEIFLKIGFVFVGAYGAYSLGANNVANVAGVWVQSGLLTAVTGTWFGSLSIALGVLTYSRRVIETVGQKLTDLDPFSAFIAMLSSALMLHAYATIGTPVSASQVIVGAVLGIGLVKGTQTVQHNTVIKIFVAWFAIPALTALLAVLLYLALPR